MRKYPGVYIVRPDRRQSRADREILANLHKRLQDAMAADDGEPSEIEAFEETDHPRDSKGKFAEKGGGDQQKTPKGKGALGTLKEHGWSKTKIGNVNVFTHPEHGKISYPDYVPQKVSGMVQSFTHTDKEGNVVTEKPVGVAYKYLKEHAENLGSGKGVLPDDWKKLVEDSVKEQVSKHAEEAKPVPVEIPTPAAKYEHPVPAGMPEGFVTKEGGHDVGPGNEYHWNKDWGGYESSTHPVVLVPGIDNEEIAHHLKPDAPKEESKPEPAKPTGPPGGLPASVKGPKGGVYNWNESSGTYLHKGGYELTHEDVATKLKSGKLTDSTPASADKASKIPAGMHDVYQNSLKGKSSWTAVYNPGKGLYEKFKNGVYQSTLDKTPEQMKLQLKGTGAGTGYFKNGYGYVPAKNATLGTKTEEGPKPATVPTAPKAEELKPTVPDVKPLSSTLNTDGLTYKGSGAALGGAHEKHIYTDKEGAQWMFKPGVGAGGKLPTVADEVASKVQMLVNPKSAVEAKVATLPVPGKGDQTGSVQKLIPDVKGDLKGTPINSLTGSQVAALQKEQVVDWMLSNHDAHAGQFVEDNKGGLYGIDKSQAFKFFGKDSLDTSYHPNTVEAPPIYNQLWQAVKNGDQTFDPHAVLPTIEKAQSIPDHVYKQILTPYAEAKFGTGTSKEVQQFLQSAVDRKNSLKEDFEKLYSNVLGKAFTFDSKSYSSTPADVPDDLHKTLENNGYQFKGMGAKTGFAKYKDGEGKTVYVKPSGEWEFYPKGSSGMNPAGSVKSDGAAALNNTLIQPVDKTAKAASPVEAPAAGKMPGSKVVDETKNYPNNPAPEFKQTVAPQVDEMRAMAEKMLPQHILKGKGTADLSYERLNSWSTKLGTGWAGGEGVLPVYSGKSQAELVASAKGQGMYAEMAAHFGLEPRDLAEVQNAIRAWSHSSSGDPQAGKLRVAAQELVSGKCCSDKFGKAVALEHAITRAKLLRDVDWADGEGKLSRAVSGKQASAIAAAVKNYDTVNVKTLNAEGYSDNKSFSGSVRLHDNHVSVDHVISCYKTNPDGWAPHFGEHEFVVAYPGAWKEFKASDIKVSY